jgi:hypothetical protein
MTARPFLWVVKTAQYLTGTVLPPIQDFYSKRCLRKARSIIKDPTHPCHKLFTPLPSSRRYRSMSSDTNRLRDSFYLQAIGLLNTWTGLTTCSDSPQLSTHALTHAPTQTYTHPRDAYTSQLLLPGLLWLLNSAQFKHLPPDTPLPKTRVNIALEIVPSCFIFLLTCLFYSAKPFIYFMFIHYPCLLFLIFIALLRSNLQVSILLVVYTMCILYIWLINLETWWDVNCLINSGTTPVWKHLLSIYIVSLIYSSLSIILAVTCTTPYTCALFHI